MSGDRNVATPYGFGGEGAGVASSPIPTPASRFPSPGQTAPCGHGEGLCKCAATALADSYEGAWTPDPTNGPWTSIAPTTSSQDILFTGLDRGKDYYFRVRAIGANGPSGWSDVATMMVV